jgi:hypothetical protein
VGVGHCDGELGCTVGKERTEKKNESGPAGEEKGKGLGQLRRRGPREC